MQPPPCTCWPSGAPAFQPCCSIVVADLSEQLSGSRRQHERHLDAALKRRVALVVARPVREAAGDVVGLRRPRTNPWPGPPPAPSSARRSADSPVHPTGDPTPSGIRPCNTLPSQAPASSTASHRSRNVITQSYTVLVPSNCCRWILRTVALWVVDRGRPGIRVSRPAGRLARTGMFDLSGSANVQLAPILGEHAQLAPAHRRGPTRWRHARKRLTAHRRSSTSGRPMSRPSSPEPRRRNRIAAKGSSARVVAEAGRQSQRCRAGPLMMSG